MIIPVPGSSYEPLELFALGDDGDAIVADGKSAGADELGPTKNSMAVFNVLFGVLRPFNAPGVVFPGVRPLGKKLSSV